VKPEAFCHFSCLSIICAIAPDKAKQSRINCTRPSTAAVLAPPISPKQLVSTLLMESGPSSSAAGAPQTPTVNFSSSRGRSRHRHRPRKTNPLLADALPTSGGPSRPSQSGAGQSESAGYGRGRGRGRGDQQSRRRGNDASRTVQGRQFGGQLTQDPLESPSSGAGPSNSNKLHADAPTFVPGSISNPPPRNRPHHRARPRRLSKSSAPDIATRIHEDVENRLYECAVCTNEIVRQSKIWSCRICWSVFHISCVKKWSSSESAKVSQGANQQQQENGELPQHRQWRCPGCNLPQDAMPLTFSCWCGKETDPVSTPGLPPFSCGQSCSRPHQLPKACPHPCSSMCHAGPCMPCSRMGPIQSCFCGKEERSRKCIDTDYENGWTCGQICGDLMPCGQHFCDRPCHEGLCGACEVPVEVRCYCGQVEKEMHCFETGAEKSSQRLDKSNNLEKWTGSFVCGNICSRPFGCEKHMCEKPCHSQDAHTAHCPRSPDVVTNCPCGKTLLADLSPVKRASCDEEIPSCTKRCNKPLECGHPCQKICHIGDCGICFDEVEVSCRCGRTNVMSMCHQGMVERPICMKICRVSMSCGRHECGDHCCPGEKKAAERMAKKRPRLVNTVMASQDVESEHICTRVCDRPLKCGNHTCPELCHRGACGTCREAIFDEISCHCGKTVLQPPLPCGTQPPPCRFECERPKSCGHPQVSHNCHMDGENCPNCPFLVTKTCLCGKNLLKNQPCFRTEVQCGEVCGKKLKCGAHLCRKPCHRPGECEDMATGGGVFCQQACGREKSCSHPCSDKCHAPSPCKEIKPCQHKILITCECQRIKQEARCSAVKGSSGNSSKTLPCDEECLRLERNRKLQLAFNIDPDTHTDDHIPYSADTINMYLAQPTWCQAQEKLLRALAADPEEKRLRLKPMKSTQRAFLHTLCQDFGFDSESMDPEPHRHVAIFKTPRFVMAPMKTIGDCVRIKQMQQLIANPTAGPVESRKQKSSNTIAGAPFNALLVTNVRFGLTTEELRAAIAPALSGESLTVSFLPSEEVVLLDPSSKLPASALEAHLTSLKPRISAALAAQSLGKVQLCVVDESLNVDRRESDSLGGGWSQVAAKAAAPRRMLGQRQTFGQQSSFVVLGSSSRKKKAKEKEKVVEDWEAAEELEEEKERQAVSSREQSDGEEAVKQVLEQEMSKS
jgi:transcriptional repressor NF-X1